MGQKNISSSFSCSIVKDGVSQPSYIQTQEAWSNDISTGSTTTPPTIVGSWSDSTPTKTATYLWRRSRTMTLNESTRQYDEGAWVYQRLSGENGTSINIKGHVATVSALPSSASVDDAYVVDADGNLYIYTSDSTWESVGQFKGDPGDTYYLHTAWASGTTDGTPPSKPEGQTSTPNKASVTGFSVSPFDGALWMGILVNKNVADPTQGNLYTWDYVKGEAGADAIRVDLDNENDSMLYTGSGTLISGNVVSHATLYDGETAYTTSGVTWSIVSSGCTASRSGNVITVSDMSSQSASVLVTGTYKGHTYSAALTLKKIVEADKYDIVVTPNSITYNTTTGTSSATSVSVKVYRTNMEGRSLLSSLPQGYALRYYAGSSTSPTSITYSDGSGSFNTDNSTYSQYTVELIRRTTILDSETVPINKSANGANGNPGIQGKMGRNFWYAGMWDDDDVKGQQFVVNDYQAPYVNIGTEDAPNCKVFVGQNGTYQFPTTTDGYADSSVWAAMETNFKYLITKALFSEFANLGSSIFNKDYMFSAYGELVAYGRTFAPNNANLYRYIDPTDMGARNVSRYPSSFTQTSFSNSSYDDTHRISISTFTTGYIYLLAVKFLIARGNAVAYKFASSASSANIMNNGNEYQRTNSNNNKWQYVYKQVTEALSGNYYLYYRLASGTTATIVDGYKSRAKFRPNIYADWLKGFFYSQYGKFRNVVIEGVFNNLITEIDPDNSLNSDMIVSYSVDGDTRYGLDVLRCGTIVRIKSLPSSWSGTDVLRLPYFVSDTNNDRTYTYLGDDGVKLTTARQITADEMRMLVGRKLVIILDKVFGLEQSYIRSHKIVPSGLESHTSASYNKFAIIDIANGQPHIADSTSSSSLYYNDVKLNYRKSVYMECRLVRDVDNSRYCYIWTNTTAEDSNGTDEPIDSAWT